MTDKKDEKEKVTGERAFESDPERYTYQACGLIGLPIEMFSTAVNYVVEGGGSENTGYTKPETDALLDLKADVTTVDALDVRVTSSEDNINDLTISVSDLNDTVGQLDTDIDDITEELNTKADIKVQQPSCLTLTLTGVDIEVPTSYEVVNWQEQPLLVGDLLASANNSLINVTRAGFIDLQVTGEIKGKIELVLTINNNVAPLSHFIKSSTDYETFQTDMRRIAVNEGDTLNIQVKGVECTANLGVLYAREVF